MTEPNNRKGPGYAPGPNPVFSQKGPSSDSCGPRKLCALSAARVPCRSISLILRIVKSAGVF